MSRKYRNKKGKRGKKNKMRLNKKNFLILMICLVVIVFSLFKAIQAISVGVSAATKNVGGLMTSIFKEGKNDTDKADNNKQFDLEEENKGSSKKYIVYIDVGHGGEDPGYETKDGIKEKDLDLEISKLVSARLSSQGDISVILSRNTDVMLSNKGRVEDANAQNANLFVSIHMTGNNDKTAKGIQTFYRVGADDASDELATLIQKSVVSYVNLKDRGATGFTFDVLQGNNMPAALIQCGFLSNPSNAKKLTNAEFQKNLAEGISQGILSFLDVQG